MPATKRKYAVSKRTASTPALKRRRAIRTYSGATSSVVPLSLDHQLLRTKQNCVLRYHETFTLNPGSGGLPGSFIFRSNSCYDPNFTGTGHQPRGYDQIMAMYQYLAVREAQIEIWFQPSDGAPVVLGIAADGSSGTITRDNMMEGRTAVYKAAGGISSTGPAYVSLRVKPWELAGTKLGENDYKHLSTGNPIITQFFIVTGMPLDLSDSGEINCVARLTYHCEVTEPIQPTSS
uniref:Capsid protein n=1 Tax=uncultured marine virus TaxID=186617 RepID=S4TEH5_9VIRU|nr:hypothetical protein [uncultured marine virus]